MRELPETIISTAYKANNGEYAWPRSQIIEALRAIAKSEQAILGGEVWAVKDGKIWGVIPTKEKLPGVWRWETMPIKSRESWNNYCQRTAKESICAVEAMKVEEEVTQEFRNYIFFNVTYVDEKEFNLDPRTHSA